VINDEIYWFISAVNIDEASALINLFRDPQPEAFDRRLVGAAIFVLALSVEEDSLLDRNCGRILLKSFGCCHSIPLFVYEDIFPETHGEY
jgi:hypothetical protein